jgi:hypothetical protein
VYLLPVVSSLELPHHGQLHTRLYEFSRKVAMMQNWGRRLQPLSPVPAYSRESCTSSGVLLLPDLQGRWDATCRVGTSAARVARGGNAAMRERRVGIAITRWYAVSARSLQWFGRSFGRDRGLGVCFDIQAR